MTKEEKLLERLASLESVMVAYSGGVDSALLAYYAKKALGAQAVIVIAVSGSLAQSDLERARAQAEQFDFDLIEIETHETDLPEYKVNDARRCFFCKATLFQEMEGLAKERGIKHIAYGANVDDLQDFRPGHQAAKEHNVLSPLQEVGLVKDEIRALAKIAGLPSYDWPSNACLSSRIPTFTPVEIISLSQIEKSEDFVKSLGFKQVRVRHLPQGASVEVGVDELSRFNAEPNLVSQIETELKRIGYKSIQINPQGYRQGSMNIMNKTASKP
ncbi:ATP-dependent sacrificial sulfur transferase LarE [bacterium]|nr:ATP-dependent sacrificial sulfur transferase LarE [bacterium]